MKKSTYFFASLSISLLMLSGCGSKSVSVSKTSQNAEKLSNHSSSKKATDVQTPQSNPLFQTELTLPNGEIISTEKAVKWKDLSIQLLVTSLPASNNHNEGYKEIIGNHSTVVSHEVVKTSHGDAMLVLNERTLPAASKSSAPTFEYWVIVYGNQYAYAIDASFTGKKEDAKNEIMSLLNQWKIPKSEASIS